MMRQIDQAVSRRFEPALRLAKQKPFWPVITVLALLGATAFGWSQLELSNSIDYFVDPSSEDYQDLVRLESPFPTWDRVLAVWHSESVKDARSGQILESLAADLAELPHVQAVDHWLAVAAQLAPLPPDIDLPNDPAQRLAAAAVAAQSLTPADRLMLLQDPEIREWARSQAMTGAEGDVYTLSLAFPVSHEVDQAMPDLLQAIDSSTRSHLTDGEIILLGTPVIREVNFAELTETLYTMLPLVALVSVLIVFVYLRRLWLMVVPLAMAGLNVAVTMALVPIFGHFTFVTIVALIIAFSVAFINAMYIVRATLGYRAEGQDVVQAISLALQDRWKVIALANLTTLLGIVSLILAGAKSIWLFALVGCLSVATAFVLSLAVLPLALLILPKSALAPMIRHDPAKRRQRIWRLFGWSYRRPWLAWSAIALCLGLFVSMTVAGWNPPSETNTLNFIDKDVPAVQAIRSADTLLGGLGAADLILHFDDTVPEAIRNQVIESVDDQLHQEVSQGSLSSVTGLSSIGQSLRYAALCTGLTVTELRSLTTPRQVLDEFRPGDGSSVRFTLRYRLSEMVRGQLETWAMTRERRVDNVLNAVDFDWQAKQVERGVSSRSIKESLYLSQLFDAILLTFLGSLLLVGLVMILATRRWLLALMILVLNALAILSVLGFLRLMNWPVDVGLAMVAPLVLGFAVDSVIHWVQAVRKRLPSQPLVRAMIATRTVLAPVLLATAILIASFLLFGFSDQIPLRRFGFAFGYALIMATLVNLVIVPLGWLALARRGWVVTRQEG